ncbi:MAG TPA: histidinol-phosphate transaminase [Clostridiales bacterium]|nr:histidinol-phosphate transaminase [Clostridiales bacterium]
MSGYWNQKTCGLDPYTPGEQPKEKMIKLNTNENPLPPGEMVLAAMKEAANGDMRLYPDPESRALREVFADYAQVAPENVFVGNGSDEVLAFAFDAFFQPGKPVLFPDISYSFYPVYCKHYGLDYQQVPLKEDFTVAVADYDGENGGIVITNPNAPTGIALSRREIEDIVKRNPAVVVVIDEAYVRFGAESAVPLIEKYPNLLVVQTMSKSHSLAGLRVGFAIGSPELIEGLNRVKDSFNSYPVDRIAQAGAIASLKDVETVEANLNTVRAVREGVSVALRGIGFDVLPAKTNFIMIRYWNCPAEELFQYLRSQKILVRHFDLPRISDYLRVTIGSKEDMRIFLDTVEEYIEKR